MMSREKQRPRAGPLLPRFKGSVDLTHLHFVEELKDLEEYLSHKKWMEVVIIITTSLSLFFFLSFCLFRATPPAYGGSQARGLNQSCSLQPTPQSQQRRIWAASVTYTTAHSNTGSLTHGARPGMEPLSSWILVRFITAEPQWELHYFSLLIRHICFTYLLDIDFGPYGLLFGFLVPK